MCLDFIQTFSCCLCGKWKYMSCVSWELGLSYVLYRANNTKYLTNEWIIIQWSKFTTGCKWLYPEIRELFPGFEELVLEDSSTCILKWLRSDGIEDSGNMNWLPAYPYRVWMATSRWLLAHTKEAEVEDGCRIAWESE